tara:strand:- start:36917 stop:37045 length:129 start_codon:yes stop_codon:yes gene_type:complete
MKTFRNLLIIKAFFVIIVSVLHFVGDIYSAFAQNRKRKSKLE